MAELSIDRAEIYVLMKALNLLDGRRDELSDDERDIIPILAFKLGMASGEAWQPSYVPRT